MGSGKSPFFLFQYRCTVASHPAFLARQNLRIAVSESANLPTVERFTTNYANARAASTPAMHGSRIGESLGFSSGCRCGHGPAFGRVISHCAKCRGKELVPVQL